MNPKHQEFIRLVAEGSEQGVAYGLSIGRVGLSKETCQVKGSQLAKKYAKEIQFERDRIQGVIQSAKDTNVVKNALKQVLSQAEVDAELSKIINGTAEVEKIIIVAGKKQVINGCKPDHMDKLKAIDLYNKRFGSNAPVKNDVNLIKIPAPIIDLSGDSKAD